jgi:hypothetical protein
MVINNDYEKSYEGFLHKNPGKNVNHHFIRELINISSRFGIIRCFTP